MKVMLYSELLRTWVKQLEIDFSQGTKKQVGYWVLGLLHIHETLRWVQLVTLGKMTPYRRLIVRRGSILAEPSYAEALLFAVDVLEAKVDICSNTL